MLVTPEFVFLHVPKTGGTFVRTLLEDRLVYSDYHASIGEIPSGFRHLPRYAFIRNPWDWWVSWWVYKREQGEDVGDTLEEAITRVLCEQRNYRDYGFLGYTFWRIIGNRKQTQVLRFERLREDLGEVMRLYNYPEPNGQRVNASERGDYRDYYDDFTRELVGSLERRVVRAFGYEF